MPLIVQRLLFKEFGWYGNSCSSSSARRGTKGFVDDTAKRNNIRKVECRSVSTH